MMRRFAARVSGLALAWSLLSGLPGSAATVGKVDPENRFRVRERYRPPLLSYLPPELRRIVRWRPRASAGISQA